MSTTKASSRVKSKPRISTVNISRDGIDLPKRKKSKYRRSRRHSRKSSKILYEEPGEWDDGQKQNRSLAKNIYETQSSIRERESVRKLCGKLVENFWDTAWDICSERFYHENAPATVAFELRDTWLRIIEANWLDQDLPQTETRPAMFSPDEPPEPLVTETPSTEVFLTTRDPPKRTTQEEQSNIATGGSGEPQATVEMEKEKPQDAITLKGKPGKGKTPPAKAAPQKGRKSIAARTRKKSTGKGQIKGKAAVVKPKPAQKAPITTSSLDSEKAQQSLVQKESKAELAKEPSKPHCIPPPPPPPPEIPIEVIYIASNYKGDALTPTDSRVHHCGKKDVETSKSAEDVEGHEDDVHETATQEEVKQEGSQAPTQREPKEMPAEDAKYKNGSRASLDDASGFHIKKAEILESVKPDEVLEPVNIVDRIDNLLAADSDHVVDILRPAEVEQLHAAGSMSFKVGDGEFGDHFKSKHAKAGKKPETTKNSKVGKITSGAARQGVAERGKSKKPSQDLKKTNAKEEQRPMKLQQVATVKRNEGVTKAK